MWGLIFLALEAWAGGPGVGLGLLAPEISLHMWVRGSAYSVSAPLLPVRIDVVSLIPSIFKIDVVSLTPG